VKRITSIKSQGSCGHRNESPERSSRHQLGRLRRCYNLAVPPTDVQRRMLRRVVRTFLESGKSTTRQDLLVEFQSLNDLNDLTYRNVLKTYVLGGQDYLPSALAFHYCGDAKAEDQARKAVQLLATVLRKQFLSRRIKLSREGLEEDGREVDPSCDLRMIELGIYLGTDFCLFQQYAGGNQAQPIITPAIISEQIVEIKTPNALWDDRMAIWKQWPVHDSFGEVITPTTPLLIPSDELAPTSPATDRKWSRGDKIGAATLAVAIIAIIVGFTVPEVRLWLHLDEPPAAAVPSPSSIPINTPGADEINTTHDTVTAEVVRKPSTSVKSPHPTTSSPKEHHMPVVDHLDSHDKQNWRKYLKVGMSKEDVRKLFGDPDHVQVTEQLEKWDYGTGSITFANGNLWQWLEPE